MAFKSKIAVVTHSMSTFNLFIQAVDRDDRKKFHFTCNMDSVRSMRFNQFIRLYDAYKLNDIEDIIDYLNVSVRRENE